MDYTDAAIKVIMSLDEKKQRELHYNWCENNRYNEQGYKDTYWREEMPLVARYYSNRTAWLPQDIQNKIMELQNSED
jgi:hypothetical protein